MFNHDFFDDYLESSFPLSCWWYEKLSLEFRPYNSDEATGSASFLESKLTDKLLFSRDERIRSFSERLLGLERIFDAL